MTLVSLLETLHSGELAAHFTHWRTLPVQPARYADFPPAIDPRLRRALASADIERLYSHQAEAISRVLEGRSVVIVTPTASGKTLCYNLPVLNAVLADPGTRALYLFPTKALSQDQLDELHGLIGALDADIKTFTYDGDTPQSARRAVRAAGHIVVSNPDMLHTGILPHHTKWVKLFENLRYVVIDELHHYRGVFGSHLANVVRRLRRVCRFYGADPVFICCSATIANPRELAEAIVGSPVELVEESGAPSGEKVIALYNPPVVNRELGIRRSALQAARGLASRLIAGGVQTIVFAASRVKVELLTTYLRESLRPKPGEPARIRGYRGGYLPLERREIERDLRSGEVRGVVATNALELGIDIGGLDASVLTGYPGTLASTWQQFGRAGRRTDLSFAVLVASSSPLDQYVVNHPEYLFERPVEAGLVNPDNLYILASHLKCAAFELPFSEGEGFGAHTPELLDLLCEEGVLHRSNGRYHWMSEAYPAEEVSLRSAFTDNFVVIEEGPKPRVIGEVDRPSAPMLVHEEAIYIHQGQQYHVERLDWEEGKAYVRRVNVDYYTDANLAVDLRVLECTESSGAAGCERSHGEVAVTYLATIFKKIKLDTHENVGWGKIRLPQEDMHTTAYWLSLPSHLAADLSREQAEGALRGLANVLLNVAPLFLMCDPRDIRVVSQTRSPATDAPTVFIYDNYPGGVGFSPRLYEVHADLLRASSELVAACPCEAGCPSCVGPRLEVGAETKGTVLRLLAAMTRQVAAGEEGVASRAAR